MQKCRHRRRCHRGRRQPSVQWKQRRFYTKSKHHTDKNSLQKWFVSTYFCHIQHTAKGKIHARSIAENKDKSNKRKRRSTDWIIRIFSSGIPRFRGHCVHDKRNRNQGQHFIKHIHCHQIGGHRYSKRNSICHRVKREETVFPFFAMHIFKRIQRSKWPQRTDKSGKNHACAVQMHRNFQYSGEINKPRIGWRVQKQRGPHQNRSCDHDTFHINISLLPPFPRKERKYGSSQDWQHNW